MTGRRTRTLAMVVLLALAPASAGADEHEQRLSVYGQASLITLDAFATSDTVQAAGGGLSISWGLRNWLDVGFDGTYLTRPNARLEHAHLGIHEGTLYTDLHAAQLGGHARFALFAGPFYRLRPVATVRAGLGTRIANRPQLFLPGQPEQFLLEDSADVSVFPYVGGDVGVSWRLSDDVALAAVAAASFASSQQTVGLHLELSWHSFDLF